MYFYTCLFFSTGKDAKVKGLAAPSNLSMNQTLEGHSGMLNLLLVETCKLSLLSPFTFDSNF